jgi:hypothetical protein
MKKKLRSLFFVFCLVSLGLQVRSQDYIPNFGTNGKLTFDFNIPYLNVSASATLADRNVIIGGTITDTKNTKKFKTYLARLDANGKLDLSFGTVGYVYLAD